MNDEHIPHDPFSLSRRTLLSATGGLAGAVIADAEAAEAPTAAGQVQVDRAFVRIREGLVHYRTTPGPRNARALPLIMVHAGPGSSRGLEPVMRHLGASRRIIAPDTLGFGDSAVPDKPDPEITYFADSILRIMDALKIEKADYYGAHTGAHSGTELALMAPNRIRRLVFDGVTVRTPELRAELLAHYAPKKEPDDYGSQLHWAWQFVRDMSLFFPHYARDPEHRTANGVPSAQALHDSTIDVLKALRTYHYGYNAVYRHKIGERLPLLKQPVMCIAKETDPNIRDLDAAAATIPNVRKGRVKRGEGADATARLLADFYDA